MKCFVQCTLLRYSLLDELYILKRSTICLIHDQSLNRSHDSSHSNCSTQENNVVSDDVLALALGEHRLPVCAELPKKEAYSCISPKVCDWNHVLSRDSLTYYLLGIILVRNHNCILNRFFMYFLPFKIFC